MENSAKQAKVRDYEKQIAQLVYKLYGLTAEEIKIVEEKEARVAVYNFLTFLLTRISTSPILGV